MGGVLVRERKKGGRIQIEIEGKEERERGSCWDGSSGGKNYIPGATEK